MQYKEAQALRKEWGDKPCNHPSFEKEYYLGTQTGDYICSQCGESFDQGEKNELELKHRSNHNNH